MTETAIVSVYAVFGTEIEALEISRVMVDRKLAACANVLGQCGSIYRWQGKVEEAEEFAVVFKTARNRAQALVAAIDELHSYAVPATVVSPIEYASPDYIDWVVAETR